MFIKKRIKTKIEQFDLRIMELKDEIWLERRNPKVISRRQAIIFRLQREVNDLESKVELLKSLL